MCLPWMFGKLKSGKALTLVSSTFLPYVWGFGIFLQTLTIALLFHRISHVTHCVYILTKALLVFTLLLKIAYVELMVGKWKHALVSYISQNQTMDPWRWQITQVDQDRAHMWKVDGRWWKWNTPFMNLSLLYLDNMRTWLYIFFSLFLFSWTLMCPFFYLFFGSCFLSMPSFLSFFL